MEQITFIPYTEIPAPMSEELRTIAKRFASINSSTEHLQEFLIKGPYIIALCLNHILHLEKQVTDERYRYLTNTPLYTQVMEQIQKHWEDTLNLPLPATPTGGTSS